MPKGSGGGGRAGRGGGGGASAERVAQAEANNALRNSPMTQGIRRNFDIRLDAFISRPTSGNFQRAVETQMNLSTAVGRPITTARARELVTQRIQGRPGGENAIRILNR